MYIKKIYVFEMGITQKNRGKNEVGGPCQSQPWR